MEEKAWKRILTKKKRKIIISIFDILSHGFWEQEVAIKNAWLWENVLLESFEISTRWKWSEKSAPRKFREKKIRNETFRNFVNFCNISEQSSNFLQCSYYERYQDRKMTTHQTTHLPILKRSTEWTRFDPVFGGNILSRKYATWKILSFEI